MVLHKSSTGPDVEMEETKRRNKHRGLLPHVAMKTPRVPLCSTERVYIILCDVAVTTKYIKARQRMALPCDGNAAKSKWSRGE